MISFIGQCQGKFPRLGPEGRPCSSDVSTLSGMSGLSFDSICSLVVLPSPVDPSVFSFFLLLAQASAYFPDISVNVFLEMGLYALAIIILFFLRFGDDKLVGGKCSVLPYGTGISHYCI